MKIALCPTYLPNIENFSWMISQKKVHFYGGLNYQKQSLRNRAEIYGANGKLKLTIPIKHLHGGFRKLDKDVCIAYDIDWQKSIGSQYALLTGHLHILNILNQSFIHFFKKRNYTFSF